MELAKNSQTTDITIFLCGQAGQWIQTVEPLLANVFKLAGYYVFPQKS